MTYTTPGWDFSLMGFRGYSHSPYYEYNGIQGSDIVISPTYHAIHAVGGDFSKTLEEWVVRFEGAYAATTLVVNSS